jgi:hypothetical protein
VLHRRGGEAQFAMPDAAATSRPTAICLHLTTGKVFAGTLGLIADLMRCEYINKKEKSHLATALASQACAKISETKGRNVRS